MISFIPRVGKVQTGQSSGGFTAIIPILKGKLNITVDPNMYRFPVRGGSPYTNINRN